MLSQLRFYSFRHHFTPHTNSPIRKTSRANCSFSVACNEFNRCFFSTRLRKLIAYRSTSFRLRKKAYARYRGINTIRKSAARHTLRRSRTPMKSSKSCLETKPDSFPSHSSPSTRLPSQGTSRSNIMIRCASKAYLRKRKDTN